MLFPRDVLARRLKGVVHSRVPDINRLAGFLESGRLGLLEGSLSGRLVERCGELTLITGRGELESDWIASFRGEPLSLGLSRHPFLSIDFGLWDYHTAGERKLLLKQTTLAISELRNFLWDGNLRLVRAPPEVRRLAGELKFAGGFDPPEEAVLLDPHAEEELRRFDPARSYVLGGIVDKSNRLRTRELGYSERRAIRLDGRIGDVPNRLNLLVRMMGMNLQGMPLKEAILKCRQGL